MTRRVDELRRPAYGTICACDLPKPPRSAGETAHGAFATVGADGQPQVTAIWAMLDGDVVRTSLFKGRQKYKNLVVHPQVTLFVIDPANPYRTLEIRAVAEVTDDTDLAFLRRQSWTAITRVVVARVRGAMMFHVSGLSAPNFAR